MRSPESAGGHPGLLAEKPCREAGPSQERALSLTFQMDVPGWPATSRCPRQAVDSWALSLPTCQDSSPWPAWGLSQSLGHVPSCSSTAPSSGKSGLGRCYAQNG